VNWRAPGYRHTASTIGCSTLGAVSCVSVMAAPSVGPRSPPRSPVPGGPAVPSAPRTPLTRLLLTLGATCILVLLGAVPASAHAALDE